MLTLGQAARKAQISKTALSRAIQKGRLSATKDESGGYQIDPAELFRVYQPRVNDTGNTEQDAPSGLQGQIEVLRELIRQLEGERDDLRTERDHWRQQATAILSDLRAKTEAHKPGLWARLLGKR